MGGKKRSKSESSPNSVSYNCTKKASHIQSGRKVISSQTDTEKKSKNSDLNSKGNKNNQSSQQNKVSPDYSSKSQSKQLSNIQFSQPKGDHSQSTSDRSQQNPYEKMSFSQNTEPPSFQSQSLLHQIPPIPQPMGSFYPYPQSPYPQTMIQASPQQAETQTKFQHSVLEKLESIGNQLNSMSQK